MADMLDKPTFQILSKSMDKILNLDLPCATAKMRTETFLKLLKEDLELPAGESHLEISIWGVTIVFDNSLQEDEITCDTEA